MPMSTRTTVPRPSASKQPSRDPATAAAGEASPGQTAVVETAPLTLEDLQRNLTQLSTRICGKLDQLSDDVNAMNKKFDELESSVKFNSAKITEMETEELPKMKAMLGEKIEKLEEKLILLEIHNRKSNLLFYGVESQQGEDIYSTLRSTFINLGIEKRVADGILIANAHRLPRRNATVEGPVPIIARFCYMRERDLVLGAYENQQRQPQRGITDGAPTQPRPRISVRTDLPPTLKARRGTLSSVAYKMRKDRGLSTKIAVQGARVILQWREKGSSKWNLYTD